MDQTIVAQYSVLAAAIIAGIASIAAAFSDSMQQLMLLTA